MSIGILRVFIAICRSGPHSRFMLTLFLLRWNDQLGRAFGPGHLRPRTVGTDMPILADALLDAGCDNEKILQHCRQQEGVHAKGCWVIDLLLDKS